MYVYNKDQELPAMAFNWRDGTNTTIDLSSGWTATIKLALASDRFTIVSTITTGMTYSSTSPNLTWSPSASDFSGLTASSNGTDYIAWPYIRRNSDSKDDVWKPGQGEPFKLYPAPA